MLLVPILQFVLYVGACVMYLLGGATQQLAFCPILLAWIIQGFYNMAMDSSQASRTEMVLNIFEILSYAVWICWYINVIAKIVPIPVPEPWGSAMVFVILGIIVLVSNFGMYIGDLLSNGSKGSWATSSSGSITG